MHTAYGLRIHSELDLPELISLNSESKEEADVVIKVQPSPVAGQPGVNPATDLSQGEEGRDHLCNIRQNTAHLFWKSAGSFQVNAGREILITQSPGTDERTLRSFLLGAVLAVLLHQRGFLILHASAVAMPAADGKMAAVAFLGYSGQGKSTMAAALHAHGCYFVADDLIAVPSPSKENAHLQVVHEQPVIYPGYPQMRLWPQSVAALGEDVQTLPLLRAQGEKRVRPMVDGFKAEPLPLCAAYVLEEGDTLCCEPLTRQQALMTLVNNSYCVRALSAPEVGANFVQCVHLAQTLPLYRLQRPRDLQLLPEVVQLVQATMALNPLN